MADRVLSSAEARQAIQRLQRLVNSDLVNQLQSINTEGQTLSRQDVWDGRLAGEFRSNWPGINSKLKQVVADLETLRGQIEKINQNIMSAGGNQ